MIAIELSDPSEWDRMLQASAYKALTESEAGKEAEEA
jgi:hypothetical protein